MRFLVVLIFIVSSHAWASPYGFRKGKFDLYTEGSFVTTSRNFSDEGVLYQLPGNNHLQETNILFGSTFDFTQYWGGKIESNIRQINGVSTQVYVYNTTTMGISDITLSSDFLAGEFYKYKFIPEFSVFIPLAGNPGDDGAAYLNDGALAISAKLYSSKDFWILKNASYVGVTWRAQGYSSQIPIGVMSRAAFSRWFFLDLKAYGEVSINNDQYTNAASNRNIKIIQYNGGSLMYGAVNPTFFSVRAALGVNLGSQWRLSAGVQQSVVGIRAPDETRIFANLRFSSSEGGSSTRRSQPKFQSDDHDQFEVDTEE